MAFAEATYPKRDYSPDRPRARTTPWSVASWRRSGITPTSPAKEMKALMQRSDQPAIRDTLLWVGLLNRDRAPAEFCSGAHGGPCRSGLPMACSNGSAPDARWHELRPWHGVSPPPG